MKVLFDTSVLVAALIDSYPQHESCFSQLKAGEAKTIQGYISTQSLAELYSVLTRFPLQPKITPTQAQILIVELTQYLKLIPLTPEDYQAAIAKMASLQLPGGGIFDTLIAQAALKEDVDILFTLNPNHFSRLGEEVAKRVQVPSGL